MGRGVLERNILGLFGTQLLRQWIGFLQRVNIVNLLNLRFHEKLILLFVHYFIYYSILLNYLSKMICQTAIDESYLLIMLFRINSFL